MRISLRPPAVLLMPHMLIEMFIEPLLIHPGRVRSIRFGIRTELGVVVIIVIGDEGSRTWIGAGLLGFIFEGLGGVVVARGSPGRRGDLRGG